MGIRSIVYFQSCVKQIQLKQEPAENKYKLFLNLRKKDTGKCQT